MLVTANLDCAKTEEYTSRISEVYLAKVEESDNLFSSISFFQQRYPFGEARIGKTRYTFKCMLDGRVDFDTTTGSGYTYSVAPFSRFFEGTGSTPSNAAKDWKNRFHLLFQELNSMRPFEFDQEQKALWDAMEQYLDIEEYRNSQPLVEKQVGKIFKMKGLPEQTTYMRVRNIPAMIMWLDGSCEKVPIMRKLPDDFILLTLGQYFEATVKRNRKDGTIIEIVSFSTIRNWEKRRDSISSFEKTIFEK